LTTGGAEEIGRSPREEAARPGAPPSARGCGGRAAREGERHGAARRRRPRRVSIPTGTDAATRATSRRTVMIKVKTFATPIRIFETVRELEELDARVADFLNAEEAEAVYGISDTATTGAEGETIGLVRTVVYEVEDED
jgi:hypothetical protein